MTSLSLTLSFPHFFFIFLYLFRYYYPNVRDQLVARGMLPLSKLCAMVTMQKQHPDEPQMFSLPLIPRTGGSSAFPSQSSGLCMLGRELIE